MGTLYQIVPLQEGTNYQGQNVGQIIQSIIIDNITPSWLYIPAANRYVPPLTWGVVFQAVANAQNTACTWQTPPGQLTPATNKLGTAQVIFTDSYYEPSSGVSLVTPTQNVHVAGPILSPFSENFMPPPGTNTLILVSNFAQTYSVFGQNSLTIYPSGQWEPTRTVYVPIDMGTDSVYLIAANPANALFPGAVSIDASFMVQAVSISNTPTVNIGNVVNSNASGSTPLNLPNGSVPYLPVQERPTFDMRVASMTLAAGTGQALFSAPGSGNTWIIRKLKLSIAQPPAGPTNLMIGVASGDSSLGMVKVTTLANNANQPMTYDFDYDDYQVLPGTYNEPIYITADLSAIVLDATATAGFVVGAAWPGY